MGELKTTYLQNRTTIDYLLLKYNLGCQQLLGMCCFNVSYFSIIIDGQVKDLYKEIIKIFQVTFECPSWLSPFLGPLIAILMHAYIISHNIAIEVMHLIISSNMAIIFFL